MLSRRIRWAAMAIAATALTGCGAHLDGTAQPGEIDVRTLDVGNYATAPLELRYHHYPTLSTAVELAEMRLSGHVVTGPDIDPALKYGTGLKAFHDSDGAAHLLAKVAGPVLDANGMMFAVAAGAAEKPSDPSGDTPKDSAETTLTVLQFPDEAAASKAATELESADFQVAADLNQPVVLPKYAAAHTHWRPGIPTLGSYLAHGSYVVSTFVTTPQPDLARLIDLDQKIFDAELALLDTLKPLDREAMLRLKYDPDGMLRQTLNPDGMGMPDFSSQTAVEPRGFLNRINDQDHWRRVLDDSGVDRFSMSGTPFGGVSMLFRARDGEAAKKLWATALDPAYPLAADAPPKVPDTTCGESRTKDDSSVKRYRCVISYRRYVAEVESDQLADAHQRAAAQYALMANSTW